MYQVSVISGGKTLKVFFSDEHGGLQPTMEEAKRWAEENGCPGADIEPMIVGCL